MTRASTPSALGSLGLIAVVVVVVVSAAPGAVAVLALVEETTAAWGHRSMEVVSQLTDLTSPESTALAEEVAQPAHQSSSVDGGRRPPLAQI